MGFCNDDLAQDSNEALARDDKALALGDSKVQVLGGDKALALGDSMAQALVGDKARALGGLAQVHGEDDEPCRA